MEERPGLLEGVPEVPGYDVGRCLGRGGSASVWLVVEHATGREHALKCLDRAAGAEGGSVTEDGMRRELRILSVLDHDHLVRAHSVVRVTGGHGGLGLVLDYAPGGSLAELLAARGRLGAGETVTVLTPVAQALAYLHTHGFAHGDVSPGNVLFTAHGKPLLADLGVGRMVADIAGATETGTAGYRDPAPAEAARAGLQPERDVFSAAAIGWFCLTGSAPGPARLRPPLSLVAPDVPPELAAALEAGLSEDWRLRPSASEFAAAIYRSATADPVDLSVSVHPEVIPRLLTRRASPTTARERRAARIRAWLRTLRPFHAPGTGSAGRAAPVPPVSRRPARHALPGVGSDGGASGRRSSRRTLTSAIALICAATAVLSVAWWLARPGQPTVAAGPTAQSTPSMPSPPGPAGGSSGAEAAPGAGTAEPVPPPADVPLELRNLLGAGDPVAAVRGLAGLRSLAYSSGDFSLLDEVNAPASSAEAADAGISTGLAAAGHRLDGFSTELTRVVALPGSEAARAVLAVTAETPPYREVDADGSAVADWHGGAELRMRLVLVRVDGAWRMSEVLAAGEGADEPGTEATDQGDGLR